MKKKLKCFVCHKEINEEEDYVFKGQTVHKGVCLKSMIDEYNTIRNLQIRNKRLCSEIDRVNKEYERIYNENCKLRENHNINDITLLDENNRLNNIIDELEKWCNECIDNQIIARENGVTTISDTFFEIVLDKLNELKENNKDV